MIYEDVKCVDSKFTEKFRFYNEYDGKICKRAVDEAKS